MKVVVLLMILLAIIVAIVCMKTLRPGAGTHRVLDDRDRPMTQWAEERDLEWPSQSTSDGAEREGGPDTESSR